MYCYKLDNRLSQLEPHEQTLSIAMLIDSAALDTTHDWLLTQRKEHLASTISLGNNKARIAKTLVLLSTISFNLNCYLSWGTIM